VDLRRGFDGLAAAARSVIRQDPLSGHVFAFLNRRRDTIKLLVWDRTGYVLLYKRLERGTLRLTTTPAPGDRHVELDSGELGLILEWLDLRQAVRRKRWRRSGIERGGAPMGRPDGYVEADRRVKEQAAAAAAGEAHHGHAAAQRRAAPRALDEPETVRGLDERTVGVDVLSRHAAVSHAAAAFGEALRRAPERGRATLQ
jgi:transposase